MEQRKMARMTLHTHPFPFQQIHFPDSCHHPMSTPILLSEKDLGTTPHLTVGEVQVLNARGILPIQLAGCLVSQVRG